MSKNAAGQSAEAPFGGDHPEYQRRMKAFEQAWHHNRLEGLKTDDFARHTAMMYARGELSDEDLLELYKKVTPEHRKEFNNITG